MKPESEITGSLRRGAGEAGLGGKEYLDLAKRIQADFDNYRKRGAEGKGGGDEGGERRAALDLLGIRDDLERAVVSETGAEEMQGRP